MALLDGIFQILRLNARGIEMNSMLHTIGIVVVSGVFLAGCMSQKESMIKEGYPASYADGFDDGCHSGKKAGGNMFEQFKKDVPRFESDSQYGQGWSDGFRQCETEEESLQRQIRMSMERQQYMEQKKEYDWQEQRHLERELMNGLDTRNLQYLK